MRGLKYSVAVAAIVAGIATSAYSQNAQAYEIDIEPQMLSAALRDFSDQTKVQVVYAQELIDGKSAAGVEGELTPTLALDALLSNTGLAAKAIDDTTIAIVPVAELERTKRASLGEETTPAPFRVAQVGEETSVSRVSDTQDSDDVEAVQDVVVVTGTNIRGVQNTASPVLSFDRNDIDLTGAATTQEFLQTLPQNFGGSQNESTLIAGAGGQNIAFSSTVDIRGLGADSTLTLVNGRRVAPGGFVGNFVDISTIPLSVVERVEVVTDGASAIYGADAVAGVVNIILRDDFEGAETSLRYGFADGGVEEIQASQAFGLNWDSGNFIASYEYYDRSNLAADERDFSRTSDLTAFGGDNFNTSNSAPGNIFSPVVAGIPTGQDGTALSETDLLVGQLNSQNQRLRTDILPSQERHSLLALVNQEIMVDFDVFLEGRYSIRETSSHDTAQETIAPLSVPETNAFRVQNGLFPGQGPISVGYSFLNDVGPRQSETEVESFNLVAGGGYDVSGSWRVDVFGVYSSQDDTAVSSNLVNNGALAAALASGDIATAFNPFSGAGGTSQSVLDSIRSTATSFGETEVWSLNLKADGVLTTFPGGDVRLAVGGEYRYEEFSANTGTTVGGVPGAQSTFAEGERDVSAVFGEVFVPLVGADNRTSGIERLEITAAVRHEDYSDFGTTTNPKIGVLWSPANGYNVRGTFGTSFKAPLLFELNTAQQAVVLALPSIFDPLADDGSTILLGLTGGNLDLQPEEADTWTVGFDAQPDFLPGFSAEVTYFNIEFDDRIAQIPSAIAPFTQPDVFGVVLTRDPTADQIADALAAVGGNVFEVGGPATSAEAIVDARQKNLSQFEVRGIDFALGYDFETDFGAIRLGYSGSYLTDYKQAFTSTSPLEETVDTINQPVDFRSRASIAWTDQAWSAAAFVNYVDGYTDNVSVVEREVDALTTVDLRLAYTIDSDADWFGDAVFSVNVQNLFDEDAPFVNNPEGFAFDPANYNPLGRFISFQATKRW